MKRIVFIAALTIAVLWGAVSLGDRVFTGTLDASGATWTKPAKVGTAAPGVCAVGETFFDSDATAGTNWLLCTGINTWTAVSGGGTFQQIVVAGPIVNTVPTTGGIRYFWPGAGFNATEGNVTAILPRDVTFKRLYVRTNDAQPATGSLVACVRDSTGFVSTGFCLTIAAGSAAGTYSNTVDSAALTAGKRTAIQFVNNATSTSATIMEVALVIE